MVTAETAVVLPVLVVLVGGLICVVAAVGAQLRCQDAAREGARAAARGEPAAVVVRVASAAAPTGASVSVVRGGDLVTVTVSAPAPVVGRLLGGVAVSASASGRPEPDDPPVAVAVPVVGWVAGPSVRARAVVLGREPTPVGAGRAA